MCHILHSGKQCIVNTFCKKLVEGSAPKPLKTKACALWLWGYVYDCTPAGISVIPWFGTCVLINCMLSLSCDELIAKNENIPRLVFYKSPQKTYTKNALRRLSHNDISFHVYCLFRHKPISHHRGMLVAHVRVAGEPLISY